jgi:hypothetical protein
MRKITGEMTYIGLHSVNPEACTASALSLQPSAPQQLLLPGPVEMRPTYTQFRIWARIYVGRNPTQISATLFKYLFSSLCLLRLQLPQSKA